MFKCLEEILQEYFGCEGSAFLEYPKKISVGHYEYFTESGSKSYGKLVSLITDLANLGTFEGLHISSDDIIENLDNIVEGWC